MPLLQREILVIEDESHQADRVRMSLEAAGYRLSGIQLERESPVRDLDERRPALAIVAVELQRGCGLDLGRGLSDAGVPVLHLTTRTDAQTLGKIGAARPVGILVTPFTDDQLLGSVHVAMSVAEQMDHAHRSAVERITQVLAELGLVDLRTPKVGRTGPGANLEDLSAREWEVLRELLDHHRVPAIARRLHISPATVRNHLRAIYAKTGVHSQQELLHKVLQHGRASQR